MINIAEGRLQMEGEFEDEDGEPSFERHGSYWSSSTSSYTQDLNFGSDYVEVSAGYVRFLGLSLRCLSTVLE